LGSISENRKQILASIESSTIQIDGKLQIINRKTERINGKMNLQMNCLESNSLLISIQGEQINAIRGHISEEIIINQKQEKLEMLLFVESKTKELAKVIINSPTNDKVIQLNETISEIFKEERQERKEQTQIIRNSYNNIQNLFEEQGKNNS
jgi:hypothetical protein